MVSLARLARLRTATLHVRPKGAVLSLRTRTLATAATQEVPKPAEEKDPMVFPFENLSGKVSDAVLNALTVKPMKLSKTTPVQGEVLSMLPELSEPYNPKAPENPTVRDLLVKAKTGTGKTVAFLVPAIEARAKMIRHVGKQAVIDAGLNNDKTIEERAKRIYSRTAVGTLIISPTRELATQIANESIKLSWNNGMETRLFVGGVNKRTQMRDFMKGRRDVVVATPGRLRDLIDSEPEVEKALLETKLLILDEADTLLDMGFRDDIDAIVRFLPKRPDRQTFLFSATVSPAIQQVARATLDKKHAFINTVSEEDSPVHAHIPQYHTVLPNAADQLPHLLRLLAHDQLDNIGKSKVIFFLPTTKMTQLFATMLRELAANTLPAGRATTVYELHSKRTQESRTATSDRFRADKSGAAILVTSDVSARGVDYPGVSRVIQVGIPQSSEQYIHRVGRTGRAGMNGRGDLVLLPWEIGFVTWQLTNVPMKPLTTGELTRQVGELAKSFDVDSSKFYIDHVGVGGIPRTHRHLAGPISPTVERINGTVKELQSQLDGEAIHETMASLLGYYISKTPELRVQKSVVLQGCKDWTVDAMGLPQPPHVSDAWLAKIGFTDGRTKHFGRSQRFESKGGDRGTNPWAGRGRVGSRDERTGSGFGRRSSFDNDGFSPDDPLGDPDEYRTERYGRDRRETTDRDPSRQLGFRSDGHSEGSRPSSSGRQFNFRSDGRPEGSGPSSSGRQFRNPMRRNNTSGGFGVRR